MTEAEIADWVRSLSKNERLILATYEGGTCMPESMQRYWNPKALESLVMQDVIRWTMAGYELTEDGVLLAGFIQQKEAQRNQRTAPVGKNDKTATGKQVRFGEPCPICETEIVKIKRETLQHIIDFLAPKFHSVSQRRIKGKSAFIPICPECDAYALGIEFAKGFPFIMKNGQESEIQRIVHLLWVTGKPFRSMGIENGCINSEE
ncbi:hypothetical protein [Desulfatitalea alkaliphila]|uniref:Uncharacterized protein n=1 Tax=Desulfatitalea alkaliphila TaxID=2929485 RepID=A0AA41R1T6_9BACT|nr:hypothetical protein [Desulfatitalea alkaliphila]MCJ8501362.1 hypothetical protein [Desulfatitalea alkaliphila]